MSKRKLFLYGLMLLGIAGFAIMGMTRGIAQRVQAEESLPEEALADLVKPSIVRIAEHVIGTAKIPAIKVDIRQRLVAVIPGQFTEVPVDEYLMGSGFIIHPDGYIATNAHVVSQETVKQMLATDSALSALYENALFLSDEEMENFLQSDDGEDFGKHVLEYVIENSVFDLKNKVAVFRPHSEKTKIEDLIEEGLVADIISINNQFIKDEKDVAILKVAETNLPALRLGESDDISVGTRAFIFGFPATAEVNVNNPAEATFTAGVVSAIKQSSDKSFKIFQTDAKVSEGSSGGPLFNDRGEILGMVTFQTDELNRVSGDNFAFALPIDEVVQAIFDADVSLREGIYGQNFKAGFEQLTQKHCDKATMFFTAAQNTNEVFGTEKYVEPYLKKCELLKLSGASLDTRWDELQGSFNTLGNPFVYLVGISLILFGTFGAAIVWLLRQVQREEREIGTLEDRLQADEIRIREYKSGHVPQEYAQPKMPQSKKDHAARFGTRKKVI